jgi:hypothetical protein
LGGNIETMVEPSTCFESSVWYLQPTVYRIQIDSCAEASFQKLAIVGLLRLFSTKKPSILDYLQDKLNNLLCSTLEAYATENVNDE